MIFPDINILLYAHDETSPFHKPASAWWVSTLDSKQVFFSWQTISGFLRIATNSRLWESPLTIRQAIEIVDSWLALDNTHIVGLEKKTWPLYAKTLIESQASGNLVMDAHIAAAAASCGAMVATTDRDFLRFSDVRVTEPIKT